MSQQMVSSQDKVTMVQEYLVQERLITAQEQLTRRPMTSADRDRLERRMYPEGKTLQAVDQYIDQAIDQALSHAIRVELDIAMRLCGEH
jgi:hypothetical protein